MDATVASIHLFVMHLIKKEWEFSEIPLRNYTMTSKGMMHNGDCFKICQGTAAVYKE